MKTKGLTQLQLAVFDDRRGNREGEEEDKLLGFYPSSTSYVDQEATVGLVQAMNGFTSIFSPDAPCESMDAQHLKWVMHCCEPHIWTVLVVEQAWCGGTVLEESLRGVLRHLHAMIALLHGPLTRLLDQDPSGGACRAAVQEVVEEVGRRLTAGRSAEAAELHNPLSMRYSVPYLPLTRRTFTGLQSLVNGVLLAAVGGGRAVTGAVVLQDGFCLWSSASRDDTAALHHFAQHALLPHSRPAPGKPAPTEANVVSVLSSRAWRLRSDGLLLLDDSLTVDGAADSPAPLLWLQGGQERCSLVGVRHSGALLLLLLLGERTALTPAVLERLREVARPPLRQLAPALAAEVAAAKAWHIKGFRYMYLDGLLAAVQASPAVKVATLSPTSLTLLAGVRSQLHRQQQDSPAATQGGGCEVVVRGGADCWVVGRVLEGRCLAVVLEGRGESNLLEAADIVQRFTDTYLSGLFD